MRIETTLRCNSATVHQRLDDPHCLIQHQWPRSPRSTTLLASAHGRPRNPANPLLPLAALLAALASFFLGRQVEIFRDLKRRLHSITSHDKTPISAIYPAAEGCTALPAHTTLRLSSLGRELGCLVRMRRHFRFPSSI